MHVLGDSRQRPGIVRLQGRGQKAQTAIPTPASHSPGHDHHDTWHQHPTQKHQAQAVASAVVIWLLCACLSHSAMSIVSHSLCRAGVDPSTQQEVQVELPKAISQALEDLGVAR